MNRQNSDTYRELIATYALGALEPKEAQAVEAHLAGCTDCQARLKEYRAVGERLLLAVPPKAPPPALRARLIAHVAAERPALSLVARIATLWPPRWPVAAGLTLAVFLLLCNFFTFVQLRTVQYQQAALEERLEADQIVITLLTSPDKPTVSISLAGSEATGNLVMDATDMRTGVLFARGLKPLDPTQTYQVWLTEPDGGQVSAGLIQPQPDQALVSTVIVAPEPLSAYSDVSITVEPAGGSAAPTGLSVLAAHLDPQRLRLASRLTPTATVTLTPTSTTTPTLLPLIGVSATPTTTDSPTPTRTATRTSPPPTGIPTSTPIPPTAPPPPPTNTPQPPAPATPTNTPRPPTWTPAPPQPTPTPTLPWPTATPTVPPPPPTGTPQPPTQTPPPPEPTNTPRPTHTDRPGPPGHTRTPWPPGHNHTRTPGPP